MSNSPLHLAVALDGAGWHPAAWRLPDARPDDLFTADYWTDLVQVAERGLLDFVTIEDSLALQSSVPGRHDDRTDLVRGRLDAVLLAARVAPASRHVGVVPTVTTTHTEPFHVSTALATLDYVSLGRAGWQVQVSAGADEAAHFGRRRPPSIEALVEEAGNVVEVVRRLWDSWEDGAEIRDVTTGRFVDRDKLHYIDFAGQWFSVRGPSITPRPPQGQPVVVTDAHELVTRRFAAAAADVAIIRPHELDEARDTVDALRDAEHQVGRDTDKLRILVDLAVFVDEDGAEALRRKTYLDELAGEPYQSDAAVFVGAVEDLADMLSVWHQAGVDGFRLRPGSLPHDLSVIADRLVPVLQERQVFRRAYAEDTIRGRLGLDRPVSRYAA